MTYLDIERGGFPTRFIAQGNSVEEAMEDVMRTLIAETSNASAKRKLEEEEIEAYRAEYTALYEHDRIDCEQEMAELEAEKKKLEERIRAKRDEMASIMQHINDNVRTINDGYLIETLDKDSSFKVVVDGHVLHYTYAGDNTEAECSVFTLARVEEVDKKDSSIFALQTANQEVFIERYGAAFNQLGNFVEVEARPGNESMLVGFKLAASVDTEYAVIQRDTIIDAQMAHWMISDVNVDTVVVYATAHLTERT